MIKTAILGFGNIGSGVAELIERNQDRIARAVPGGMSVKYVLDLRDFPDSPFADRLVHDFEVIAADPEITLACETMGGKEPAFTFTKRLLERGVSVCSSNKELVDAHGPELLNIAREHGCSYLFEASVGGGIPLLNTLINSLRQEHVTAISGILNGTTNYILTRMEREGADYAEALKEAQALGYAERNPAADVEGHDTGRKIAILASLASGKWVRYESIGVEGITRVTPGDFAWANAHGYTLKLLGRAELGEGAPRVRVAPYLVPASSPLYTVGGVFNGVLIHGDMVDDVLLYGRGAGKLPTASAVVSDMIACAKCPGKTLPVDWSDEILEPAAADAEEARWFVRIEADERALMEEAFAGVLCDVWTGAVEGEIAFLTAPLKPADLSERLERLPAVMSSIRVLA